MMLSNILHAKYNKYTGITFSSIYPGCIAESPLFREKRPWFRKVRFAHVHKKVFHNNTSSAY